MSPAASHLPHVGPATAARAGLRILLALGIAGSAGAEPPDVDTSAWACEFCPFESSAQGRLEGGLGYVSDDSFRFGRYNGLEESGLYPITNADYARRDDDGLYFDASLLDLGLDVRSLSLRGGRQGHFGLSLDYRELPGLRYDTAVTPFVGEGSDNLSLPPGWVKAGSTGGMTSLAANLHDVPIGHERKRLDLGAVFIPKAHWEYAAHFRHETRKGIDRMGGAFLTQSSILPAPLDDVTDAMDASATYQAERWHAQLAYHGSQFRNQDESLTWENPYTELSPGADRGQMARAPDNQAHQLMISGGLQPDARMQFSGSLAIGRMTQDEDLLPATLNPNLATPLPRADADARVDTLAATLRAFFSATDRLRLNAELRHNDRDNKTPRDSFTQVATDVFVSAPRTNLPYDHRDTLLRLGGDYRLDRTNNLSLGLDHRRRHRDLQDIERTDESELWARLRTRPRRGVEVTGRLAYARRDGSGFEPVASTQPPENPLHRAFNLADRERTSMGVRVSVMPREGVSVGASLDYADDDYDRSAIGLQEARNLSLTLDASATPRENLILNGYLANSLIRHEQAGSQAFAGPDWTARNRDETQSLGFGVERRALLPGIDVSGQYAYTRSDGRIRTDSGAGEPAFPDLETRLHSLILAGTWHWRPDTDLKLGIRHERFRDADWQVDGVAPATVPNVLSLGQGSPDYRVNLLTLSAEYRF